MIVGFCRFGTTTNIVNVHNILWQMLVPGTSRENLYAMNKSLIEATVIVWDHFLYIIKCLKYTVRLRKMSMLVNWIANDHEEIKTRLKHSRPLSPLSNIQGRFLFYQTFKAAVSSIKHLRPLSSLSNIQGRCLLYQTFKAAVSSIKHSRLLSPLSNIQGCCLLYQTFKAAVSSIKY